MNILFLDDNDARQTWAAWALKPTATATTADAAIAAMASQAFDVAYLDHDLGDTVYQDTSEPNSGSGVVRWIVANRPKVGSFVVHSMNTPAGNRMVQDLQRAGYDARYIPFLTLVNLTEGYTG